MTETLIDRNRSPGRVFGRRNDPSELRCLNNQSRSGLGVFYAGSAGGRSRGIFQAPGVHGSATASGRGVR